MLRDRIMKLRTAFIVWLIVIAVSFAILYGLNTVEQPTQAPFSHNTVEILRSDEGYIHIRYSTKTTMMHNELYLYVNGEKHEGCSLSRRESGSMMIDCLVESGLTVGDSLVLLINGGYHE